MGRPNGGPRFPELDLQFPPKAEYIRVVRYVIGALGKLHGIPESLSEDLKLAVSEACTSALAASTADGQPVRVLAGREAGTVVLEVMDPRSELARLVSGPPTELNTEDLPFERALSLPVIRGLVDELTVTPRPEGGASVRMVVSLGDAP